MWAKSRRDFLMGNVLGRIMVKDMVEVREGFDRSLFRANFDKPEQNQCCFTLQASHRTLNLETDRTGQRADWVTALHYIISNYQLDLAEKHWGDILEGVPEVDEDGMGSDDDAEGGTSRPATVSDSQGNKILRTMTFWKWGNREARSESDGTSSTVSQAPSGSAGPAPGLGRSQSLRHAQSESQTVGARNAPQHAKGSLLAMEERYNALLKQVVKCHRQIEILGVACGRTADMLWESGARDIRGGGRGGGGGGDGGADQPNAEKMLDLSWVESFHGNDDVGGEDAGESFHKVMATWKGPCDRPGNTPTGTNRTSSSAGGGTPSFSGPLNGKPPKTVEDAQRLAVVMVRMADNLVRGRGMSFRLSDGFEEEQRLDGEDWQGLPEEDRLNESDVPAPGGQGASLSTTSATARSSRASTFHHSATVFESLRKAILHKMEHDAKKERLETELEASKVELARLRQHGDNFDRLAKIVALLPSVAGGSSHGGRGGGGGGEGKNNSASDHKSSVVRRRSLILESAAPKHHTLAAGSLGGSRVASRIEGWLNELTPELGLSFGETARNEHEETKVSKSPIVPTIQNRINGDDGSAIPVGQTDTATLEDQTSVLQLPGDGDGCHVDEGISAGATGSKTTLKSRERRQSKRSRRGSHLRKGSLVYNFHESDREAMLRGVPERSETPGSTRTNGSIISLDDEGRDAVEETGVLLELPDDDDVTKDDADRMDGGTGRASRPKSLPPPPPNKKKSAQRRASKRPPKPPPLAKRRSKTIN